MKPPSSPDDLDPLLSERTGLEAALGQIPARTRDTRWELFISGLPPRDHLAMALQAATPDGTILCNYCGSKVEAEADACDACGEAFTGSFKAIKCRVCGSLYDEELPKCTTCNSTQDEAPTKSTIKAIAENEEFLLKLLQWGGKGPAVPTQETPEDQAEKAEAVKVLERMKGQPPGPKAKAAIDELAASKDARDQAIKRDVEVGTLADNIAKSRGDHDAQLDRLIRQVENLRSQYDASSDPGKRKALEKQIHRNLKTQEYLNRTASTLAQMDRMLGRLTPRTSQEAEDKEGELTTRIEDFKGELADLEHDRAELDERSEEVTVKEQALRNRIDDLQARELEMSMKERELIDALDDLHQSRTEFKELRNGIAADARDQGLEGLDGLADATKEERLVSQRKLQGQIQSLVGGEPDAGSAAAPSAEASAETTRLRDLIGRTKTMLGILDKLLEKLPEEELDRFADSADFADYERLLEDLGL